MSEESPWFGAVVLSGGTGARLGGADKAALVLDGTTLLEHALAATVEARETVVVGVEVPTSRPVSWTREDPPGGGPAAGILAGLDRFTEPPGLVCVLAVDMPRVTARTVARLVDAAGRGGEAAGAVLVDDAGVRQTLAGVYRRTAVLDARPAARSAESGLSVRRLLSGLTLLEVPAVADEARDVDTWQDLRALAE